MHIYFNINNDIQRNREKKDQKTSEDAPEKPASKGKAAKKKKESKGNINFIIFNYVNI